MGYQDIRIGFTQGLQANADDKLYDGPLALENAEWQRDGSLQKRRGYARLGTNLVHGASGSFASSANNSGTLDPVCGLATRQGLDGSEELVAVTSGSIASWASGSNAWAFRAPSRRCRVTAAQSVRSANNIWGASHDNLNGVRVTAWTELTSVTGDPTQPLVVLYTWASFCSVEDAATGAVHVDRFNLGAPGSSVPRVVAFNGLLYIIHYQANNPSAGTLRYYTVNPSYPWTVSGPTTIDASALPGTYTCFDALLGHDTGVAGGQCLSAFYLHSVAGTPNIWLARIDTAGNVVHQSFDGTSVATDIYDVIYTAGPNVLFASQSVPGSERVFCSYGDPAQALVATTRIISSTNDGLLAVDSFGISHATGFSLYGVGIANNPAGTGTVDWYVETRHTITGSHAPGGNPTGYALDWNRRHSYIERVVQSGTNVQDKGVWYHHHELAGHPFTGSNGVRYLPITFYADEQCTHLFVDASVAEFGPCNVWGQALQGSAYPPDGFKPRATLLNGRYEVPMRSRRHLQSADGLPLKSFGAQRVTFDLDPPQAQMTQADGLLLMGGGIVRSYDGQQAVELGFLHAPQLKSFTNCTDALNTTGSAGARWPQGLTISASADFWPSFSVASDNSSRLVGGTYQYMATYRWFDALGKEHRSSPVVPATLALFTTGTNGGYDVTVNFPTVTLTDRTNDVRLELWRTENNGSQFYLVTSGAINELLNANSSDNVTFVDTMGDSTLVANEALFTDDGELDPQPPPAATVLTTWRNRAWLVDDSDGLTLWFSKGISTELAVEFSDLLTVPVDPVGGRVTALAGLDDKLIIFKADRVFYLLGDGPDSTGANGSFSGPFPLTSEVGCSDPRSIVRTSRGLEFRSSRGIFLLAPDGTLAFVGAGVDPIASRETTGASVLQDRHHTVFTHRDGSALVHNTLYDRWSTVSSSLPMDASTVYAGTHVVGGNQAGNGIVLQQLSGTFLDNGQPYGLRVQLPWVKPAGVDGAVAVREVGLLGTFKSDHNLGVTVEYDHTPSGAVGPNGVALGYQDTLYPVGNTINATSGSLLQLTHRFHHRRCEAVRVTFQDSQQSGSSESFSLEGARLGVQVRTGGFRVPPGRRF